jgi:hypothetical protein
MIRILTSGGPRVPLPRTLFLVLGGACLAAALGVGFASERSPYWTFGLWEALGLAVAGGVLLAVGFRRRPPWKASATDRGRA